MEKKDLPKIKKTVSGVKKSKSSERLLKSSKKTEDSEKAEKTKIKKAEKQKEEIKEVKKKIAKPLKYLEAVGRRKTSVARARLFTQGEKKLLINNREYREYFPTLELQRIVTASLEKMKCSNHFRILIKIKGGGVHSQAEAARHGITRALVKFNPDFQKRLRRAGYITRDPRVRERKKFGLKRARRAPQWSKR